MDPTVFEATIVRRCFAYAEKVGADLAALRNTAGFTEAEVADTERMLPIARAVRLFQAASNLLHDPALGLHVAAASRARDYGLIGLIFDHQPRLDDGLDVLSRTYSAFLASASLEIIREPGRTRVVSSWEYEHAGLDFIRQDAITAIYLQLKRVGGGDWLPLGVRLRQASVVPEEFERLFGIPVTFGAEDDELILDPVELARPNPNADPIVLSHLMEAAEVHLERRRAASGQQSRVLHLSGCTVDLTEGVVRRGSDSTWLTTKERDLLEYFANHKNEVVTHEEIERDVWHIGRTVVSHAPAVAIRRLRQKIEPPKGRPVNLVTVFGEGWKLVVSS